MLSSTYSVEIILTDIFKTLASTSSRYDPSILYLESCLVYESTINTVEELVAIINLAFDELRNLPQIFRETLCSTIRYTLCINNDGRSLEQSL